MSIVEFSYQWHNPKNPKCRSCKFWVGNPSNPYNHCSNNESKVHVRHRAHNDKGCKEHTYQSYNEALDAFKRRLKET